LLDSLLPALNEERMNNRKNGQEEKRKETLSPCIPLNLPPTIPLSDRRGAPQKRKKKDMLNCFVNKVLILFLIQTKATTYSHTQQSRKHTSMYQQN